MKKNEKIWYLSILCSFFLGILLNYLGIDISKISIKYVGILLSLQNSGVDIHIKSIIFFVQFLIVSLCFFYGTINDFLILPKKIISLKNAIQDILTAILSFLFCLVVLSNPINTKLNKLIQWDFSFSIVISVLFVFGLFGLLLLFRTFRNFLNRRKL